MDHRNYTYPDRLLEGRIILITGASDGIGRALAIHAAGHGAQVILHGRSTSKLESVYDEIEALESAPRPAIAVLDFAAAGSEAYTSLADSLADEFGRLDGLVNNASVLGERYSIEQYDVAMWQKVMHVNVTATLAITQVCLPLLHRSGDASIIFTSSGVGRVGKPFWGAYAVSKFATEGLSQVLASEQEHGSIRVNCINPGPVRTAMRRAAYPAEDHEALKTAEEILPTYMYLLGPDSNGVTGRSLDAQE
jgi:NAD(P)-dependent dehydrogenase (short-subunit alcohol dehydrogenase family)